MGHFQTASLLVGLVFLLENSALAYEDDKHMHPRLNHRRQDKPVEDSQFWIDDAQRQLESQMTSSNAKRIEAVAKNVVFFLGDGMSVPTITAARIFKGQQVDKVTFGEEASLHMDSLPNIGVSKTFCADSQVADSACSATAYLCGVKNNIDTIGVKPSVLLNDCAAHADPKNHVSSIFAWAQAAGKSTGVVTTTRITHASPAGTYAHTANRDWESDAEVMDPEFNDPEGPIADPNVCHDIAHQLIMNEPGKNINVILGGGRLKFLPAEVNDTESGRSGARKDGLNLVDEWTKGKEGLPATFVSTRDELRNVDTSSTDFLFGLFAPSHLEYLAEQEEANDPSLEEMTRVAIEILSRNPKGFFLFVEGGRIDHAHHDNQAQRALWETIEFDKAIKRGDEMTDDTETLLVVTADHAHVMSIAGYPVRGNKISGIADTSDVDDKPYTTLAYINGPGYRNYTKGSRPDVSGDSFDDVTYQPPPGIPLGSETHGGDDVLIFSKGPYAHFLTGVQQQSYIPHLLAFASCTGEGKKAPECSTDTSGSSSVLPVFLLPLCLIPLIHILK